MSISEQIQKIISLKDVNDFCKLILIWLVTEDTDFLFSTNKELAEIFNKHHVNISKAISELSKQELIKVQKADNKRVLTLSEFSKSFIIINNKINNDLLLSNSNNKNIINKAAFEISENDCDSLGEELISESDFIILDPLKVKTHLMASYQNDGSPLIFKNISDLKDFLLKNLEELLEKSKREIPTEIDDDLLIESIQNFIRFVTGNKPLSKKVDERELKLQSYRKREENYLKKILEEKVVDITNEPRKLQSLGVGHLVKVIGKMKSVYKAGAPPIHNIVLSVGKEFIYITIHYKHFKILETDLTSLRGKVKVSGEVIYSKWHEQNRDAKHIIRSTNALDCLEFLEDEESPIPILKIK